MSARTKSRLGAQLGAVCQERMDIGSLRGQLSDRIVSAQNPWVPAATFDGHVGKKGSLRAIIGLIGHPDVHHALVWVMSLHASGVA